MKATEATIAQPLLTGILLLGNKYSETSDCLSSIAAIRNTIKIDSVPSA